MNRLKDSKGKCEKTAEIIEKPFDARVEGFLLCARKIFMRALRLLL